MQMKWEPANMLVTILGYWIQSIPQYGCILPEKVYFLHHFICLFKREVSVRPRFDTLLFLLQLNSWQNEMRVTLLIESIRCIFSLICYLIFWFICLNYYTHEPMVMFQHKWHCYGHLIHQSCHWSFYNITLANWC